MQAATVKDLRQTEQNIKDVSAVLSDIERMADDEESDTSAAASAAQAAAHEEPKDWDEYHKRVIDKRVQAARRRGASPKAAWPSRPACVRPRGTR